MDTCTTMKVKPWGKNQGEFVEINAEDFDPKIHHRLDDMAKPKSKASAK